MRLSFAVLAIAAASLALPAPASAADASRRKAYDRAHAERGPARGYVTIRPAPGPRRVIVEQETGERLIVTDADGVVLRKAWVDARPPRRIEERVYTRGKQRAPFMLYGGFFGLDRWGYSRAGW